MRAVGKGLPPPAPFEADPLPKLPGPLEKHRVGVFLPLDVLTEIEGQPHALGVEGRHTPLAGPVPVAVFLVRPVPDRAGDADRKACIPAQLHPDPAIGRYVRAQVVDVPAVKHISL